MGQSTGVGTSHLGPGVRPDFLPTSYKPITLGLQSVAYNPYHQRLAWHYDGATVKERMDSMQDQWRRCTKCEGLFYAGGADGNQAGVCPAWGRHEFGVIGDYALAHNEPDAPGQPYWRWCHECEGLFFAGEDITHTAGGLCPHEREGLRHPHYGSQSGEYTLVQNGTPDAGEGDWWWCRKCAGLFCGGGATGFEAGVCPAGAHHNHEGSGNYRVKSTIIVGPTVPGPDLPRT
jgi:hypothetical protein